MCPIAIQTLFLNSSNIFRCSYSLLNVPDETAVKVTFMNGKLENCVVLPKGLRMVLFIVVLKAPIKISNNSTMGNFSSILQTVCTVSKRLDKDAVPCYCFLQLCINHICGFALHR